MKNHIIFLTITFLLPLISAFDCSSLTNQTFCEAYGCTYTANQGCTGSFISSCTGTCYYVEANAPISPGTGTLASPYASVKDAFKKVSTAQAKNGVYSIIILTKSEAEEFNLTGTYTYNAQMTFSIRPYVNLTRPTFFVGQLSIVLTKLTFSMEMVKFSTRLEDYDVVKQITATLLLSCNLTNLVFENFYANKNNLNTGFLSLANVDPIFKDIQVHNAPGFIITGAVINSFTVNNLLISSTTFKQYIFSIEAQQLTATNLTLLNVTQDYTRQGEGIFQVIASSFSSLDVFVKFQNVFVRNFTGLLLSNTRISTAMFPSLYHLSNFDVQNANASTQYILFNILRCPTFLISDSKFQRIENIMTLLNVEGVENFTLQNTVISDIKTYQFENIDALYDIMGTSVIGSCMMSKNSSIHLVNTSFSSLNYNCFSFTQTNFTFDGVLVDYEGSKIATLPSLINTEMVGPIMTLDNSLNGKISNSFFLNNYQYQGEQGAGILIQGEDTQPVLEIQGSTFRGLKAERGAAIYSEIPYMDLIIDGCTFENNEAIIEGGAIYLNSGEWNSSLTVKISGTKFKGNEAEEKGGAIFVKDVMLDMNNCDFVGNLAENGGAFFGTVTKTSNEMMIKVTNNYFSQNKAENVGGALRLIVSEDLMEITGNSFVGNIAEGSPTHNDILTGNPTQVRVNIYKINKFMVDHSDIADTNSFALELKKNNNLVLLASSDSVNELKISQKTGQSLQYLIEIQCLGDDGEVFDAVNGDQLRAYFESSQTDYYTRGDVEFTFSQGSAFIYNQLQLFGNLHTQETLYLSPISGRLPNLNGVLDFTLKFKVDFIDCEKGEIYQEDLKTCSRCEAGSVSFGDPYTTQSCTLCLEGTYECLGGSIVSVNQGYWRSDENSLDVYECRLESACLGGIVEEEYSPYGHCEENYQGNLCNSCVDGYAKADGFKCSNCGSNVGNYFRFLGISALQLIFTCFVLKFYLLQAKAIMENINTEQALRHSAINGLTKIIISFMQTLCILSSMDLQWPLTFSYISTAITQVVPSDKSSFTIDCFIETTFGREQNPALIKFAIFTARPFISCLLIAVFIARPLIFQWRKTKIRSLKYQFITAFVLIGFVMQPGIMQMGIEIFKCVKINTAQDSTSYMYLDLDLECGSASYLEGTRKFVWPLFIWTNVLPVLLILATFKKFKNRDKTFNSQYFLLFAGYKRTHFYWEYWVYFRKMILMILTLFTYSMSSPIRVWFILFLLTIMLMLQLVIHPFETKLHNDFEALALFCLCLIVGFQIYIFRGAEDNDDKTTAITVLGTIVLIAFVIRFFWLLIPLFRKGAYIPNANSTRILPADEKIESPREQLKRKKTYDDPQMIVEEVAEETQIKTENDRGYRRVRMTSKTSEDFTWRNGAESARELKEISPLNARPNSPRDIATERETLSTQRGFITEREELHLN